MEWTLLASLSAAVLVLSLLVLLPPLIVLLVNRQGDYSKETWVLLVLLTSWVGLAFFWFGTRPKQQRQA